MARYRGRWIGLARWVARWVSLGLALAVAALWVFSIAWPSAYFHRDNTGIGLSGGSIWLAVPDPSEPVGVKGWCIVDRKESFADGAYWICVGAASAETWYIECAWPRHIECPIWLVWGVLAAAMVGLWWKRLFFPDPTKCAACRYSLVGLRPSSAGSIICPECGRVAYTAAGSTEGRVGVGPGVGL